MAGPFNLRAGVNRKSKTYFNPNNVFDAGEVVTEVEITTPPTKGTATVVSGGTRVRYVAPDTFAREDSFAWRMLVSGVWTSPATVRIRVGKIVMRRIQKLPKRPIEPVPIVPGELETAADTATTAFRTPVTIDVLANDTGTELFVAGVTQPANGTAEISGSGATVTYTPTGDFTGADTFMYIASDGAQMAVGTVTVAVSSPLLAAVEDSATTLGTAPVLIYPLNNDVGAGLVITSVGTPSSGTASVSDGGSSVTYRANYGYFGDDSFSYTIRDASARTSTGTITVTVQRPSIEIVGNPASTTTTTPVEITVLANDVGVGLKVTGIPFPPDNGTATVTGGGQTVTYTANVGFTGTDSFTYRAADDYGQSGTADVTVTVAGSGATIRAVDDTIVATAGVTTTVSPLLNDTGAGIEIQSVDAPSAGGTAVRTNGNSQILYTPLASFNGTETIRYTITNGSLTSSATITATVGGTAFTVANDSVITTAGTTVTFSPLANDTGAGLSIARINGPVTASVTVRNDDTTVTPPPPATDGKFPNGYSYRYRLRLPKWTRTGTMANFLLPFSATLPLLKTTGNGGYVEKAGGWDIRFETTTGTKLGHRFARYVATTGEIAGFLNMPRDFAKNEVVYCYFGNSLRSSTEEDATLTATGGWRALYAGNSGTDLAGTSTRNLTPTSSPPASTLDLWPAADLDGVADCLLSTTNNALGLNGQSAVSIVSFHKADSTATKHEIFNIFNGTDAELSFHFNEATNNRITATAKFGSTVSQMQSSDNKQVTTAQAVAVAWQAGQPARMAINGALDTPGSSATPTAGTTLSITDALEWGRGGRSAASTTYWDGKVAALMFFSGALSTAALESITKAFSDPASVFQFIGFEAARDIFDNPWNIRSSHHRPVGAGATYYIRSGVDIVDYSEGRRNAYATDLSPTDSVTELRNRIGAFRCGDTAQGRKYNFRVSATDNNATWDDRDSSATITMRTPDLQTTTGGPKLYIPPYDGADFEYGFAPVNGVTSPYKMQRFNKCDYTLKQYSSENEFDMSLTDNFETAGGLTGGAGLKWPGLVLRGHEINPANPLPIRHALNCTATRHDRVALDPGTTARPNPQYLGRRVPGAHILSRRIIWPASRTDGSVNPKSAQYSATEGPFENQGPCPYGTLLVVRPQDRTALYDLITTARGRAMIDCMIYYGCYIVDGQGQLDIKNKGTPSETVKGVLQLRIDGLVGLDEYGRAIANVISQINAALQAMVPYLYAVGNRLRYDGLRAEDAPNGLPYIGGAKTLGDGSKQWVLDADNPDRSMNDAYDAPDGGWYEGG